MTDASSRRVSIYAGASIPGAGSPVIWDINRSRASGQVQIDRVESDNIRTSRDVQDQVQLSRSARMTISMDLHYDDQFALWRLMKSVFRSDADDAPVENTGAGRTANQITGLTTLDDACEVGDIVRIDDSGTTYYRRLTAVGTNTIDFEGPTAGMGTTGLAVERGRRLKVGKTAHPMTVVLSDDTNADGTYNAFEVFTDMHCESMRMRIADGDKTTIEFQMIGADSDGGSATDPATAGGGSYLASPTTEVFNVKGHVKDVLISAAAFEGTEYEVGLSNSLRPRTVVGTLPAVSVGAGTARTTGLATQYFETFTEYQKAINDTASSFLIAQEDAAGNALAWSVPRLKYSDQTRDDSGQDTDIIVRLPFQGVADEEEGVSLRLHAFDA